MPALPDAGGWELVFLKSIEAPMKKSETVSWGSVRRVGMGMVRKAYLVSAKGDFGCYVEVDARWNPQPGRFYRHNYDPIGHSHCLKDPGLLTKAQKDSFWANAGVNAA